MTLPAWFAILQSSAGLGFICKTRAYPLHFAFPAGVNPAVGFIQRSAGLTLPFGNQFRLPQTSHSVDSGRCPVPSLRVL